MSTTIATDPFYVSVLKEAFCESYASTDILWNEFCLQTGIDPSTKPANLSAAQQTEWLNFEASHPVDMMKAKYQALFNAFMQQTGTSATAASTPELQSAFKQFVTQCLRWGISLDNLSSSTTLPTSSEFDFYRNFLTNFYGISSTVQHNMLWKAFLNDQHLTNPVDSPELRLAFSSFIRDLQDKDNRLSVLNLSPNEVAARTVMYEIITEISRMLTTTQQTVNTVAQTLIFLGNYQQMYTTAMTSVPSLAPGNPGTVDVGAQNPADIDCLRFTFGYYNISLDQVIRWGVDTAQKNAIGTSCAFGGDTTSTAYISPMGRYSFSRPSDTSITMSLDVQPATNTVHAELSTSITLSTLYEASDVNTSNGAIGSPMSFADLIKKIETKVPQLFTYSDGTTTTNLIPLIQGKTAIPGRWLESSGTDNTSKWNIQARTERNVELQQYGTVYRTKRTQVSQRSKQTQSLLQSVRDNLNGISDIWSSTLETISTCMRAVLNR